LKAMHRMFHERWKSLSFFLLCGLVTGTSYNPAIAQTAAIPASGFQGIWYEVTGGDSDYPNKYGGGLATYPQQITPMGIYSAEANKTFFAFNFDLDPGNGLNIGHAISYFDHATGLVARPQIWINKQTEDAHDAPTLAIDDDGYIYMFSMTHGEVRQAYISKSSQPFSINSYTSLLSPSSPSDLAVFGNPPESPSQSGATRFSYASPWYVPNAQENEKFLLLHTRYLDGQRDLFTTSSIDGDTWTSRKSLAQIESGQYQLSWIKPDGETVGSVLDVHPTGLGLDWRTDLYYLQTSDQAKTWQTIDGVTLVNNTGSNNDPLTSRPDGPGDGAAQVYDAAPGERVYFKDLNYDATGNPVILFLTSPTHIPGDYGNPGPDRFVKTAHWTGSNWQINNVTTTDHNYDHGSLYVEDDGTWRIIAPFIDGPQQYGTGGEMGMWTSTNQGQSWNLDKQLTAGSYHNHTYARRPLNAQDDFYAFWAEGNAFERSDVTLLYTNKSGDVFQLPFNMTTDFAAPVPFVPIEPPEFLSISGEYVSGSLGVIESLTINRNGSLHTFKQDRLYGAHLVAFGGQIVSSPAGHIADIVMPPSATAAPSPSERAGLLGDVFADTGFVNLSSWSVAFDDAIFNRPGPDIILLDWGSSDTVDISINGITQNDVEPTSTNVFDQLTNRKRFQSNQRSVDTLAELIAATFSQGPSTSGSSTGYAIDLSDFGFALGEFLLAGQEIGFSDGQGIDPTGIFGLPTPGDFDLDSDVDGRDLMVWQRGSTSEFTSADLKDWQSYFGVSVLSAMSAEQRAVPEPSRFAGSFSCLLIAVTFRFSSRFNF
jgi:hypothetical protein